MPDGDCGFWSLAPRASAGSLGQANPQALIADSRRYRSWLLALPCSSVHRLVANIPDGDCGFWSLARAASAGSLGQANPQALIGQSAATASGFWLFRVLQFTVWSRTYPMATAVSGRWPRAASAGSLGQANPQALIR